jgi:hypothetical protein
MSKSHPLTKREQNAIAAGQEAMYGDIRESKGVAKPVIPELRQRAVRKAVGPSEHQIQAAIISWWGYERHKYGLPDFALLAVPNGGARDAITGARLKAEGVRRGIADLFLAVPTPDFHGCWIELKTEDGVMSEPQKEFAEYVRQQRYYFAMCKSVESARTVIYAYLQDYRCRE